VLKKPKGLSKLSIVKQFIKIVPFAFGLYVVFVFNLSKAFSQNNQYKIDSLRHKLTQDSLHIYRFQKIRPYVNLDQRNSFIKDKPINVNGLQAGILLNDKHVIGLGGYNITLKTQQIVRTKLHANIPIEVSLNMSYGTAFYQYVVLDKRYVEIDIQAELGMGTYEYKRYTVTSGKLLSDKKSLVFVGGAGPLVSLKPFKWIGATGMIGYRAATEKKSKLNFSSIYYSFGVWLDVRQIIRDINFYAFKRRRYRKQITLLVKQ